MNKTARTADPLLFLLALFATLVGMVFIFDAGYPRALSKGQIAPPEFVQQVLVFLGSMVVYTFARRIPSGSLRRAAPIAWVLSLVGLILVEFVGHSQNEAQRWIKIAGVPVQPSEFAKLALVLFLAATFADRKVWAWRPPRGVTPVGRALAWGIERFVRIIPGLSVLFAALLVERGKDIGTACVLLGVLAAMCVLGNVRWTTIAAWGALIVLGAVYFVRSEPYRMARITAHAHRWEADQSQDVGYQTTQAELGMATGGVGGTGLGNGLAKRKLPAATTDFVLATVGEETGLWGYAVVIGLVGGVVARLLVLARRCADAFGALTLGGLAAWLTVQGVTNAVMANGTIPAIGIPVPFISSGGSSLFSLWCAVAVAQAVASRPRTVAAKEARSATAPDRRGYRRSRLSGA